MSAVVDFVDDTVSGVSDVVGDIVDIVSEPIEWIGDTIEDVGEWAVEEIFDPVIESVEDSIKQIGDDPVKFAAQVAAVSTGQYWALPLIEGADVAAEGGSIEDVLLATGEAYIMQQIGVPGAEAGTGEVAENILTKLVVDQAFDNIKKENFDDDPPPEIMGTEEDVQFYGEELPEDLKESLEDVNQTYQDLQEKAGELDELFDREEYAEKTGKYNEIVGELQNKIDTQNALKTEVDDLQATIESTDLSDKAGYANAVDNYNKKVKEYNSAVEDAGNYYNEYFEDESSEGSQLQEYISQTNETIASANEEYQALKEEFESKGDALGVDVAKIYADIENQFVENLTGGQFNAEQYKTLNDLGDITDQDAKKHFLKIGRLDDLPVNQTQYDQQYTEASDKAYKKIIEDAGLDIENITQEQKDFLLEEIVSYEGGKLKNVKDITEGSESLSSLIKDKISEDIFFISDVQDKVSNVLSESGVTPNESGVINYGDLSQTDKDKIFDIAKDYYSPPEPVVDPEIDTGGKVDPDDLPDRPDITDLTQDDLDFFAEIGQDPEDFIEEQQLGYDTDTDIISEKPVAEDPVTDLISDIITLSELTNEDQDLPIIDTMDPTVQDEVPVDVFDYIPVDDQIISDIDPVTGDPIITDSTGDIGDIIGVGGTFGGGEGEGEGEGEDEGEGEGEGEQQKQGIMALPQMGFTPVTVSVPDDAAKIGPAYDFKSIFRNPLQDAFYQSPYSQNKANEELLRLITGGR